MPGDSDRVSDTFAAARSANADDADAEGRNRCLRNSSSDGSRLRLRTLCMPNAGTGTDDAEISNSRRFEIDHAPRQRRFGPAATLKIGDMDNNPSGHAGFVDIGNDGYPGMEVRGLCGAAPTA